MANLVEETRTCPRCGQALCWNCNMAKARNNGTCPHENDRALAKELEPSRT